MNILSIETSTDWCGIALIINGKCINKIQKRIPKGHSENLPIYYKEIINESKNLIKKIDAISVSIGPGSFTGLRIGLGFAKGLAFAKNLPIIPVPTLEIISNSFKNNYLKYRVYLFSHRDIVYHQKFTDGFAETLPEASKWDLVKHYDNGIHYGCDKLLKGQNYSSAYPLVEVGGLLAYNNFNDWVINEPYDLIPNYISPFELGSR